MKKLETLLSIPNGRFATRKGLNRSEVNVPQSIVHEIEAGHVTSEMLKAYGMSFPIFMYKTCITLHGLFNLSALPKIGGYKNLIQNKNGSLEIRYTAIDWQKKKMLGKAVSLSDSGLRMYHDSTGTHFQKRQALKERSDIDLYKPQFVALSEKIQAVEFYGQTRIFLAQSLFGDLYMVLDLELSAIPASAVDQMAEVLTGLSISEVNTRIEADIEKRLAEKAERDAETAKRDEVRSRQQTLVDGLAEAIKSMPAFAPTIDAVGVRAQTFSNGAVGYKFIRITGKGSFGKFKYQVAGNRRLDAETLNWKDAPKQAGPKDWQFRSYRLLTTVSAKA